MFAEFLTQARLINPDLDEALKSMKPKIDNEVFREWCDAISDCQYDRGLKSTLTPIVSKLSDMRIVNGELEYLIFEPRKEFIIMAILVIGNVPLMYFLNQSWYNTLMHTPIGQATLAVCAAAIFISTAFVIKLTKSHRVQKVAESTNSLWLVYNVQNPCYDENKETKKI